jgi:hypothetical protein
MLKLNDPSRHCAVAPWTGSAMTDESLASKGRWRSSNQNGDWRDLGAA